MSTPPRPASATSISGSDQPTSPPPPPKKPSGPSVILAPRLVEPLALAAPPHPSSAEDINSLDLNALLKRKGPNPNQTLIYDHNGHIIASLNEGQNRHQVKLDEIASVLQQAVVASEDIRFFSHGGVDPRGLARAILYRGKAGGGSTITQQLAKNLFLSFDRSVSRKITEVMLAVQLEKRFTKKQILEMYLNRIYWGHGAYGVESAAHKYFGKTARELTLPEAALLAGIIPGPELFSPYRNPELGKRHQLRVLERMVVAGHITPAQAAAAAKATLTLAGNPDEPYRAPYFVSEVLAQLCTAFGSDAVFRGGLRVHTTLDLGMQEAAEGAIRSVRGPQAALVAIQPGTGAVRALVGGTSWARSQYNRATQSRRQAGSTFKPFVYLAAFEAGSNPLSTVVDEPTAFGKYRPQNADRRHHGRVTFEQALAGSLNVSAVRVANNVGMGRVQKLAKELGILSPIPSDLSAALGSADVGLAELATAYATVAADGRRAETHLVARVEDRDGRLLYDVAQIAQPTRPVASPRATAALHHCLQAVITSGTGRAAGIGRPAAGKTGTTDGSRDALFAGYTPDLACVVWLGNDDNRPVGGYGGTLAAPVWRQFMTAAHRNIPVRGFPSAALVADAPPPPPPAPAPAPPADAPAAPAASSEAPAPPVPAAPAEPAAPAAPPAAPAEEAVPAAAAMARASGLAPRATPGPAAPQRPAYPPAPVQRSAYPSQTKSPTAAPAPPSARPSSAVQAPARTVAQPPAKPSTQPPARPPAQPSSRPSAQQPGRPPAAPPAQGPPRQPAQAPKLPTPPAATAKNTAPSRAGAMPAAKPPSAPPPAGTKPAAPAPAAAAAASSRRRAAFHSGTLGVVQQVRFQPPDWLHFMPCSSI